MTPTHSTNAHRAIALDRIGASPPGSIAQAHQLKARADRGVTGALLRPMQLFHGTNLYLTVLFVAVSGGLRGWRRRRLH